MARFLAALFVAAAAAHQSPLAPSENVNGVPYSTRAHWMSRAVDALYDVHGTHCPEQAFGATIVNHTAGGLGELVCIGANDIATGNPTLHGECLAGCDFADNVGEIAAINNCSSILAQKLSGDKVMAAWADLSLYTTAEPCPMCATAIRWAGFKEVIYGSSTRDLLDRGWTLVPLSVEELFSRTDGLQSYTDIVGPVATDLTNGLFDWQYQTDEKGECPAGCKRVRGACREQMKL